MEHGLGTPAQQHAEALLRRRGWWGARPSRNEPAAAAPSRFELRFHRSLAPNTRQAPARYTGEAARGSLSPQVRAAEFKPAAAVAAPSSYRGVSTK